MKQTNSYMMILKWLNIIMVIMPLQVFSQNIVGGFFEDDGDDNEIYFRTTNLTSYPLYMTIRLVNEDKNQAVILNYNGLWYSNGYGADFSVVIGPNFGWNWEKGEKAEMYINGNYYGVWICNIEKVPWWEKALKKRPKVRMKGLAEEAKSMLGKIVKRIR